MFPLAMFYYVCYSIHCVPVVHDAISTDMYVAMMLSSYTQDGIGLFCRVIDIVRLSLDKLQGLLLLTTAT